MFSMSPVFIVILGILFIGIAVLGYHIVEDIIPDIKEVFTGDDQEDEEG